MASYWLDTIRYLSRATERKEESCSTRVCWQALCYGTPSGLGQSVHCSSFACTLLTLSIKISERGKPRLLGSLLRRTFPWVWGWLSRHPVICQRILKSLCPELTFSSGFPPRLFGLSVYVPTVICHPKQQWLVNFYVAKWCYSLSDSILERIQIRLNRHKCLVSIRKPSDQLKRQHSSLRTKPTLLPPWPDCHAGNTATVFATTQIGEVTQPSSKAQSLPTVLKSALSWWNVHCIPIYFYYSPSSDELDPDRFSLFFPHNVLSRAKPLELPIMLF